MRITIMTQKQTGPLFTNMKTVLRSSLMLLEVLTAHSSLLLCSNIPHTTEVEHHICKMSIMLPNLVYFLTYERSCAPSPAISASDPVPSGGQRESSHPSARQIHRPCQTLRSVPVLCDRCLSDCAI